MTEHELTKPGCPLCHQAGAPSFAVSCVSRIRAVSPSHKEQGGLRLSGHGICLLGVPALLGSHAPCPLAESWQERAPRAAPQTHPTSSGDHCTARCACKDYLKIAKHNVCCEAFPLLSPPPASCAVTRAVLPYLLPPALPFPLQLPPPSMPRTGQSLHKCCPCVSAGSVASHSISQGLWDPALHTLSEPHPSRDSGKP